MPYSDQYFANLYDLIACLIRAVDLVNPKISIHHQQVAYMAFNLANAMQLPMDQKRTLVLAALLHDIGSLSLDDKLGFVEEEPLTMNNHAFIGARLFGSSPFMKDVAEVIKFHHIPWNNGEGKSYRGEDVPLLSHILHLSDRIAIRVNNDENVISQIQPIKEYIKSARDTVFPPELVDTFFGICDEEALWLELVFRPTIFTVQNDISLQSINLTLDETVDFTKILSQIIDFRSPFTATHSAGVAAVALKLAELSGFSESECKMMSIAGNLHDIGKLAIPREILEKTDALEPAEYDIIKSHTFYTYHLLEPISKFEAIAQWAAYHHEKLNGHGYPFHIKADNLSLGSRIMAVADIFTAITEDRPYRKGMPKENAEAVLGHMVENESISQPIVSLLVDNYATIAGLRGESEERAAVDYSKILSVNCNDPK
ncbi:MAG: phosphohydrolase [Firmicutes bacterium HGW-Firmicutes-16]|nr:MAG: phosphohydrolase [Firmicutes bacterium HGW-Firmicutes-16]